MIHAASLAALLSACAARGPSEVVGPREVRALTFDEAAARARGPGRVGERMQAIDRLPGYGADAGPVLIEILDDPNPRIARKACMTLGVVDPLPAEAVSRLCQKAFDQESHILARRAAAHQLARLAPDNEEARAAVAQVLESDNFELYPEVARRPEVLLSVVSAYQRGSLDDEAFVKAIRKCLGIGEPVVSSGPRSLVGDFLPALGSSPGWSRIRDRIGALRGLLQSKVPAVRHVSVLAIAAIDPADESCVPVLIEATKEGADRYICGAALSGFIRAAREQKLSDSSVARTLSGVLRGGDAGLRWAVCHQLAELGPEGESELRRAMEGAEGLERKAIEGLLRHAKGRRERASSKE